MSRSDIVDKGGLPFKVGDKAKRRIDDFTDFHIWKEGKVYNVEKVNTHTIVVNGVKGAFRFDGFIKAEDTKADPFPHTVYVKFDNYPKEYSYLCDDETASSYKLWRAEALHGEYRVNVETKDGVKTPYVTRLALNKKPSAATKCIIPFTKVEVPVIEVGDVVKRKAEEANTALPDTYEVIDIDRGGWVMLKGKEQHRHWNNEYFDIVSKKCENTALQEDITPVKSPLDDVVSIDITPHRWQTDVTITRNNYPHYSKEYVDKLVEEGKIGAVGLDMWKRTGTINPDFIHPSPSQAKTLGGAVVEYCKKEYSPGSTWDLGGHCLDGIHPTREAMEAVSQAFAVACKTDPQMIELLTKCKQQEEVNMSNRKVVSVKLIDQDKGLDVADSLVFDFGNIVTEDDQATTIQQLIMDFEVGEIVRQHNEVRVAVTDLDVLKRTGQEVKLREIKLKDLSWSYTVV